MKGKKETSQKTDSTIENKLMVIRGETAGGMCETGVQFKSTLIMMSTE